MRRGCEDARTRGGEEARTRRCSASLRDAVRACQVCPPSMVVGGRGGEDARMRGREDATTRRCSASLRGAVRACQASYATTGIVRQCSATPRIVCNAPRRGQCCAMLGTGGHGRAFVGAPLVGARNTPHCPATWGIVPRCVQCLRRGQCRALPRITRIVCNAPHCVRCLAPTWACGGATIVPARPQKPDT